MAEPDRHGQRAGQGPATGGLQPHRPGGWRPGERRVRPPGPDGGAGRDGHARSHQLPRLRRRGHPRGVPARHVGPGRRADHQRPVQDRRPAARRDGARPRVQGRAGDRVLRLDHPPHRRRRLRHRRGRPGRVRGGPVDPDLQAPCRGRAQPRRLEVHPLERAPARPHGRRPPRPGGLGRGGLAAAAGALPPARPRRHRGSGRRDHRALGGGDAGLDPCTPGRDLPVARAARPGRRLADRHQRGADARRRGRARCWSTTRARPRPARTASTSSRTTPTPTRRSRCAACSTPRSRTTTAAWRPSRSRRPRAASSTRSRPSRARRATSSGCSCRTPS